MNLVVMGVLLALVVALSAIGGYAWRDSRAVREIAAANDDTNRCTEAAALKQTVLDRVTTTLTDLRKRHADMKAAADAAIESRDHEIAALKREETARTDRLRKAGHEDPECTALAAMPVCTAVARELWPVQAAGRDHPTGNR